MKVFFLIQRFDKPSSRYRVLQYLPYLRAAGIDAQVAAVSGRWWGRWGALQKARRFPVIFIQKKLFLSLELRWLQSKGAKLIYDFDDAIMLRHKPHPGSASPTRERQFRAMVERSQLVVAGNRFLEKKAGEWAQEVVLLPTTIDTEKYAVKKDWGGDKTITLGWMGSPSTLVYLEQIMPALAEVSKRYPRVRLKVVSSVFPKEYKLETLRKIWKEEEEEKDLHSFDIGLAPLADDLWCEGKCGLKLLQYMACGVPTVSSPGGAQKEIIEDGVNGFLADSQEEWVAKLSQLVENTEKRKEFGLLGRQTVEQKYSLRGGAFTLVEVVNAAGN